MAQIISLLQAAIVFGTVIMFGCVGETLSEKAGNLNLGVPGIMYIGGISSLAASFFYEKNVENPSVVISIIISIVACFAASALAGLIFSFLTITLRANQNVTGLTLTIFGSGVANFFGGYLNKLAGGVGQISVRETSEGFRKRVPVSDSLAWKIPMMIILVALALLFVYLVVKEVMSVIKAQINKPTKGIRPRDKSMIKLAFRLLIYIACVICLVWMLLNYDSFTQIVFSYGFMTYVAVLVAVLTHYFLKKTRKGLNLRAVGENPATADAAGISIVKYKYLATIVGAGISGMGGLYYVMEYIKGTWANDGTIEGLGWLAVALVIFTVWKPLNAIWGAYLFGILYWMYFYVSGLTRSSQELFKMLPYLVTILVLIISSLSKKKENQAPASLGLSYFREDR